MERRLIDFWVGVFVLIGIIATVIISLKVANLTGLDDSDTYTVTANFENVGNLKLKAPVKNSGVIVGRVSDIYLDTETHEAVTKLEIQKRYKFTTDTSASIFTAGVLGEQYIGLQNGYEEQSLKDGDNIFFTSSALLLEKLISEFMFNKASESVENK